MFVSEPGRRGHRLLPRGPGQGHRRAAL